MPLITIPTKVNMQNRITRFSILDQIWVSQDLRNHQVFAIPIGITDHYPVGALLEFPFNSELLDCKYKCRPILERGKATFTTLVSNLNVNVINGSFNDTYNEYFAKLFECYNIAFPVAERPPIVNQAAPWMSFKLKQCIKKKAKLYKLYLKGKVRKNDYTIFKNTLTAVLRRSKHLHYAKVVFDIGSDSHKIWSFLNGTITKKTPTALREVKVGNSSLTGQELVNYANNYFSTITNTLINNGNQPSDFVFTTPSIAATCFFYPTSYEEVRKVIMELKNTGNKLFDIHPVVLKENSYILCIHFTELYNLSIVETEFPDKSKIARVTPTHKGGPPDIMDNYRPISVLPTLSKVF